MDLAACAHGDALQMITQWTPTHRNGLNAIAAHEGIEVVRVAATLDVRRAKGDAE